MQAESAKESGKKSYTARAESCSSSDRLKKLNTGTWADMATAAGRDSMGGGVQEVGSHKALWGMVRSSIVVGSHRLADSPSQGLQDAKV